MNSNISRTQFNPWVERERYIKAGLTPDEATWAVAGKSSFGDGESSFGTAPTNSFMNRAGVGTTDILRYQANSSSNGLGPFRDASHRDRVLNSGLGGTTSTPAGRDTAEALYAGRPHSRNAQPEISESEWNAHAAAHVEAHPENQLPHGKGSAVSGQEFLDDYEPSDLHGSGFSPKHVVDAYWTDHDWSDTAQEHKDDALGLDDYRHDIHRHLENHPLMPKWLDPEDITGDNLDGVRKLAESGAQPEHAAKTLLHHELSGS